MHFKYKKWKKKIKTYYSQILVLAIHAWMKVYVWEMDLVGTNATALQLGFMEQCAKMKVVPWLSNFDRIYTKYFDMNWNITISQSS